jgi:hypothetical protein
MNNLPFELRVNIQNEIRLVYSSPICEDYLTGYMLKIYEIGYKDAINSRLDSYNYCRVTGVAFLEEVIYLVGYRIGTSDYNLEITTDIKFEFDDTYKKIIKESLMIKELGEIIANAEITLKLSKMN